MTSTTAAQTNDISANISWTYIDGITNVKIIINNLKVSQWFAIGLSLDDLMVLNLFRFYRIIYLVVFNREKIMYLFVNI
jgi:hypothetical protein